MSCEILYTEGRIEKDWPRKHAGGQACLHRAGSSCAAAAPESNSARATSLWSSAIGTGCFIGVASSSAEDACCFRRRTRNQMHVSIRVKHATLPTVLPAMTPVLADEDGEAESLSGSDWGVTVAVTIVVEDGLWSTRTHKIYMKPRKDISSNTQRWTYHY